MPGEPITVVVKKDEIVVRPEDQVERSVAPGPQVVVQAQPDPQPIDVFVGRGIKGDKGDQGTEGPVGPPGSRDRGQWSSTVTYETRDGVGYQGRWWGSLQDGNYGNVPSEGPWWTLRADKGDKGDDGGTYVHDQSVPASDWDIVHDLGFHPSVMVVDSADSVVYGEIRFVSVNELTLHFSGAFSGKAYLS